VCGFIPASCEAVTHLHVSLASYSSRDELSHALSRTITPTIFPHRLTPLRHPASIFIRLGFGADVRLLCYVMLCYIRLFSYFVLLLSHISLFFILAGHIFLFGFLGFLDIKDGHGRYVSQTPTTATSYVGMRDLIYPPTSPEGEWGVYDDDAHA
jgi:hypothetical protein